MVAWRVTKENDESCFVDQGSSAARVSPERTIASEPKLKLGAVFSNKEYVNDRQEHEKEMYAAERKDQAMIRLVREEMESPSIAALYVPPHVESPIEAESNRDLDEAPSSIGKAGTEHQTDLQ